MPNIVNQHRLRAMADGVPAMIAHWDRDLRNVAANAAYLDWFGRTSDQMIGRHIREVLGADAYLTDLPFIRGVLEGTEQLFDRTSVDQDGRLRHTQVCYVPETIDGEVRGFVVLATDVTSLVETQRAMEEAQALAELGSWQLVPATGELTWTPEMYSIVGVDPDDGVPSLSALFERVHPEDRDRARSSLEDAIRTGRPYTSDYRIVRTDGSVRDVVSKGHPASDGGGRVVHVAGTLQDLTETMQLGRELAAINAELRRVNELNGEVMAMLGHDIRSPLGTVRNYLEMLDQDWPILSADDRRKCVSGARRATASLTSLVDQILTVASAESGTIEPVREPIEVDSVIAEVVEMSGVADVMCWRPEGLPTRVVFDRVHLAQILGNLLTNARRYGAAPIGISLRRGDDQVTIAVTDNGDGVPAAQVDALFTKFARTGARQTAAGGLGFGLYMSRKLAEANGASLVYHPRTPGRPHEFALTILTGGQLPAPGSP